VAKLLEPEGFTAFRLRRLDAPRLALLDDIATSRRTFPGPGLTPLCGSAASVND